MSNGRNQPQEPPLDWFIGYGRKATGVSEVMVNEDFLRLGDELETRWERWNELEDPINSEHEAPESRRQAEEDAHYIQEKTGFPPRVIVDKINLLREYRHKKEAPFRTELY